MIGPLKKWFMRKELTTPDPEVEERIRREVLDAKKELKINAKGLARAAERQLNDADHIRETLRGVLEGVNQRRRARNDEAG